MQGFIAHITPGGKFLDFFPLQKQGRTQFVARGLFITRSCMGSRDAGIRAYSAEGFAYGAPEDGGGRLSLRGWRAWAWKKRRADLARRFAVIRFSLRGPSGMGGQRRAAVGAACACTILLWIMIDPLSPLHPPNFANHSSRTSCLRTPLCFSSLSMFRRSSPLAAPFVRRKRTVSPFSCPSFRPDGLRNLP